MFLKLKRKLKNIPCKIFFRKYDIDSFTENNYIDIIDDKFCYKFEKNCIGISLN
jgi:hypothetical protein